MLRSWIGGGILRRWGHAISKSGASPNDPAFIQRIIAERDAALLHGDRARGSREIVHRQGLEQLATRGADAEVSERLSLRVVALESQVFLPTRLPSEQ